MDPGDGAGDGRLQAEEEGAEEPLPAPDREDVRREIESLSSPAEPLWCHHATHFMYIMFQESLSGLQPFEIKSCR